LAGIPAILPHLVLAQGPNSKSIAKELIPQFRDNLNNYPALVRGISDADVGFMDFIRKINDFSEVICLYGDILGILEITHFPGDPPIGAPI
jgi:hypothetical protein